MRNKTGWERFAYGADGHDKLGRAAYSNVQSDNGDRIPFTPSPGILQRMKELRELKRLRGLRGRFSLEEVEEARFLSVQAVAAGWTYREVARALGVTDGTAKNYTRILPG